MATANKILRHLRPLWHLAIEERLLQEAPRRIARLKEPRRAPKAWKVHEVGMILEVVRVQVGLICDIRASRWWAALVLVLYDTGLRISPVMDLRWSF